MKSKTQTNKTPALFDDNVELIDCTISQVNIIHKNSGNSSVTPKNNNNIFSQSKKYHRSKNKTPQSHNDMSSLM